MATSPPLSPGTCISPVTMGLCWMPRRHFRSWQQSNEGTPLCGVFLVAQKVKNLSAMQETWVQSLGREDPLEKEMATHSSILAWKIPWTEEPGRLQSTWGCKELERTERLTLSLSQWGGWRRADLSLGHFSCSFSFGSRNSRRSREELGDWVCCCWVFLVSAPDLLTRIIIPEKESQRRTDSES